MSLCSSQFSSSKTPPTTQEEMSPNSFKCSSCSKAFPTSYDLSAHLQAAHRFHNDGVPPPPPPQIFNPPPAVERDEVNQPSLTLSIGRSKLINDHDTMGLTMAEREYRTSRYHPYFKPTTKGEEHLVETVDDNFEIMDLLREWVPKRGLEGHSYDSDRESSSSSPKGEKLDLDLKLGF